MAWVSDKPLRSGRWRAGYTTHDGRQVRFTGTDDKRFTMKAAARYAAEELEIRIKMRALPGEADRHAGRPVGEVITEYLDFGKSQGGKRGMAWSKPHAKRRASYLAWWTRELGLQTLGDLSGGILGKAQQIIRQRIQETGRGGKTCSAYREALVSFCGWAARMKYLASNPVADWPEYDKQAMTKRRALAGDEIGRLLATVPERRALIYETALSSGLRANELRSLRVGNLDAKAGGLRLESAWTKNRRDDFQPLSRNLMERLAAAAKGKSPEALLLDWRARMTTHYERVFRRDLKSAGIRAASFGGVVNFHALRVTYLSLADQAGATAKELQTLARHSTPSLTMNTYVRTRQNRLTDHAEAVGKVIEDAARGAQEAVFRENSPQLLHARATGTDATTISSSRISGKMASLSNPLAPIFFFRQRRKKK